MPKVNYGIDAPPVIRNLLIVGGVFFIFALIAYFKHYSVLFFIITGLLSLIYFGMAAMMVWSSRYGKIKVAKEMINSLSLNGNEKILDVGCGRGLLTITAAKKLFYGKVIGIDIWRQEDQFDNSQKNILNNIECEDVKNRVEIVTCDMQNIIFPDCSFDVVVSSLAIHNVDGENNRNKVIQEIARVLKPGGHIALLDFQYVDQYKKVFESLGWKNLYVSKRDYRMFPPVRILTGTKPL